MIQSSPHLIDLLNFDRDELTHELSITLGAEAFRAKQLIAWLYKKRQRHFETMSDISRQFRMKLQERYRIFRPRLVLCQQSKDGTRKYLFELDDGYRVETVLIKQPTRYTLCVSSQVGCAIGCAFCRTGLMGLKRNLRTSEIIGQVLAVQDDIEERAFKKRTEQGDGHTIGVWEQGEEFQNIVFMGMGEPLRNLENVLRSIRILNDGLGLNFSRRKITVSTSGLVPAIKRFGKSGVEANLAVSLNATTDDVRDKLIPINRRWPIHSLFEALRDLPLKRRQRITIEYVMLKGVNDTIHDLHRLPQLLQGLAVKLNLIPYNNNAGLGFEASTRQVIEEWHKTLLEKKVSTTVRWSKGEDINAACGQLATPLPGTQKILQNSLQELVKSGEETVLL